MFRDHELDLRVVDNVYVHGWTAALQAQSVRLVCLWLRIIFIYNFEIDCTSSATDVCVCLCQEIS